MLGATCTTRIRNSRARSRSNSLPDAQQTRKVSKGTPAHYLSPFAQCNHIPRSLLPFYWGERCCLTVLYECVERQLYRDARVEHHHLHPTRDIRPSAWAQIGGEEGHQRPVRGGQIGWFRHLVSRPEGSRSDRSSNTHRFERADGFRSP